MIHKVYDVYDRNQRNKLLDVLIRCNSKELAMIREYKPNNPAGGFVGHAGDASFAVRDSEGVFPLEVWARKDRQIRYAVDLIQRLTSMDLKEVDP
jgi:hypothetical protein